MATVRFPVAFLAVGLLFLPALAPAQAPLPEPTLVNFELVGHDALLFRGMNAAPALYEDPDTGRTFVYVGSRTDGSPHHLRAGVLVVEVTDPANPAVVGEIGLPQESQPSMTSRELRVWPQEKLLLVLNFGCSALLHACLSTADAIGSLLAPTVKFYDLADPVAPLLVSTYLPSRTPHEFFLWVDPLHAGRALLYMSTPTSSSTPTVPNLIVTDITDARGGMFPEVVRYNPNALIPSPDDVRLHSLGVNAAGTRAYLAYLGGGFLVLDTSALTDPANAAPSVSLVTAPALGPRWGDPGAHSAVKVPSRPFALVTDEVYGDALDPLSGGAHGCPWGWVRLVDIGLAASESDPEVVGEYKVAQNDAAYCSSLDGQDPSNTYFTSYSSHNPTVLANLALVTWHSAGLQAIDITDPAAPTQAGVFVPVPLPAVVTEDPALSGGRNKVVSWSYPILHQGLVYIVDVRNGLYVLEYTGPHAEDVAAVEFLEGNSNLGDALLLE